MTWVLSMADFSLLSPRRSSFFLFRNIDTVCQGIKAKLKTWTLNKSHQAQRTSSYGGLKTHTHTHTHTRNTQNIPNVRNIKRTS